MFTRKVDVVIRSFKAGIGYNKPKIDQSDFDRYKKSLIEVITNIKDCPQIRNIYVVTNGDSNSPLAESVYEDGTTPTTRIASNHFGDSNVKTLVCEEWGLNPGSCNAINVAIETIKKSGKPPRWLFILSKEIQMNSAYLHEAIRASNLYSLFACGFFRQNHWERYQWDLAQNTACLWDYQILKKAGGFDTRCDGKKNEFLDIDGKKVLLAGMDDFYLQLKILKAHNFTLRWGMVLNEDPLYWNVSGKNLTEMEMHIQKIIRQEMVIKRWIQEIFTDSDWKTIMGKFFSRRISL